MNVVELLAVIGVAVWAVALVWMVLTDARHAASHPHHEGAHGYWHPHSR